MPVVLLVPEQRLASSVRHHVIDLIRLGSTALVEALTHHRSQTTRPHATQGKSRLEQGRTFLPLPGITTVTLASTGLRSSTPLRMLRTVDGATVRARLSRCSRHYDNTRPTSNISAAAMMPIRISSHHRRDMALIVETPEPAGLPATRPCRRPSCSEGECARVPPGIRPACRQGHARCDLPGR